MRLADFEYELPEGRVATEPAEPRDAARLLVLGRDGVALHRRFRDLPEFLKAGDCVVLNRTKVLPARLSGKKPTGGHVELLMLSPHFSPSPPEGGEGGVRGTSRWLVLSRQGRPGLVCGLPGGETASFIERAAGGEWIVELSVPDVAGYLETHGDMPLPPYILKARDGRGIDASDKDRYQTVYAETLGSVAAPTAGLHFTPALLERLKSSGVALAFVTTHIGWGTFRPILSENVEEHRMLPEPFEVDAEAARTLAATRAAGGRIVSVGTSCTRALESLAALAPQRGQASLFITPGHAFRHLDALITNFHLPASTPLLLACAFAGRERLLGAYREAIREGYRFYSYGDATLLL